MANLRSLGNGVHPVGPLSVANYALNPGMELPDPGQTANARINLCTNPNFEGGSTGWSASGTVLPTISQTSERSYFGSGSLKTVWGTAGTSPLVQGPTFATTVGLQYTVSAFVYVPTGSPAITINLNDGGTLSGTSGATNQWVRISQTFTASGTSCTVQFTPASAPTSGQLFYLDGVMYEQSGILNDYFDGTYDLLVSRTNLCTNPSFETGTSGWTVGGTTPPTIASSSTRKIFGTKCGLITWAGGSTNSYAQYALTTVVGKVYTVSCFVYVPSGSPGALLSITGLGSQASTVFNDWQRLSLTFTATSTTTNVQVIPTTSVAGTCYLEAVLMEQAALGEYFDGSLPPLKSPAITQAWSGTAHASTSIQRASVGKVAWNGTANASASTRWDLGLLRWTPTNAIVTQVATSRANGAYCAKLMPSSNSLLPLMSQTLNVLDLTNYSISLQVSIPSTITGGGLTLRLTSYDSTSALIQVDFIPLLLSGAPTNGFIRLAATYQTPAGAASLTVAIQPAVQPSSTSDVILLDNVMFEQADTSSETYVDGSFSGQCWSGTPHDSTTLQTEFPDALNFFGTYIWQKFTAPGSTLPMGSHATLHEAPWSPVPLTD